jgi:hypothetical protein
VPEVTTNRSPACWRRRQTATLPPLTAAQRVACSRNPCSCSLSGSALMRAVRSVIASSGRSARNNADPRALAASARSRPSARFRVASRSFSIANSSLPALRAAVPNSYTSTGSSSTDGGSASALCRYVTATSGSAAIACAMSRLSQRLHRLRVAAGMGRQEMGGNPIRCLLCTRKQSGGALVGSSTFLGAQLGVDARADKRGGTNASRPGSKMTASTRASAAPEAVSSSRPASWAARVGSAGSPSTATARAREAHSLGRRLRRARTARPTPCELSWPVRPAFSRLGAIPRR